MAYGINQDFLRIPVLEMSLQKGSRSQSQTRVEVRQDNCMGITNKLFHTLYYYEKARAYTRVQAWQSHTDRPRAGTVHTPPFSYRNQMAENPKLLS